MENIWSDSLWKQFGASIDMLINVVESCPENYFIDNKRFFYLACHSAVFLDYYLTLPPEDFSPELPFTSRQPGDCPIGSVGDLIPDRIFSSSELANYIRVSKEKCKKLIDGLKEGHGLEQRFTEGDKEADMDYSLPEILIYNLRHTQHHVGQLHILMRQDMDRHMDWAFREGEIF